MKRGDFWTMVQREANFMIDKHEELTKTLGQAAADDGLEQAILASNLLVRMQTKQTLEQKLNNAVHHTAFCIVALWLDFQGAGVDKVTTIVLSDTDENGEIVE